MLEVNVDELQNALMDYYGSAMGTSPTAVMELARAERATADELVEMARELSWF